MADLTTRGWNHWNAALCLLVAVALTALVPAGATAQNTPTPTPSFTSTRTPTWTFSPTRTQTGTPTFTATPLPVGQLRIYSTSIQEGNLGTRTMRFKIDLIFGHQQTVEFKASTSNGTATAPADYKGTVKAFRLAPGVNQATFDVPIIGDFQVEPNETLFATLSSPVNAVIVVGTATGTIVNDD